ncbi:uncharacterized protein CcaverHIS019_0309290 [Cutaneotrichosporon cavernicola]|uniref:Malic enzyme n=1 Tax=Cutaneotrichosporon cavernicola TaxID=279322 RepID=A0AA48KZS4_9TREE|nr:uncharacterized protein CcaverHIS019_0309290 [Cutaneotrichosporon cavernicola]BEI90859.1 hypothetical protein CcaverHIS019_0309290 [Cutaneotrichosporon cavernicola]BEJ06407.1 hypothetical protein CcaverHIS641_0309290 [Cutaneotrichosporon cavernicola]
MLTRPALRAVPRRVLSANRGMVTYEFKDKTPMPIRTNVRGSALLNTPSLNKGAGFSREERSIFGLEGLLPYDVHSLEKQCDRAYNQLKRQPTPLLQHVFLASMRDQNQILFYRLLQDHLRELLGIIYTPVAGEAVQQYSSLFRRPIGCFLSFPNRDGMRAQLEAHLQSINIVADVARHDETTAESIDLVVVTDGEDQGVGGITISTSKASLYTIGAGINPNRILPVVLDVGTNNPILFSSDLYMGWKRTRIRGKNYDDFVESFIKNFEDFGLTNAYRLMEKYRSKFPMFNDDIQGTGAVTLAAIVAALKVNKGGSLKDQRIVIYGAGSAGMGVADAIREGMEVEDGLSHEEASRRFWAVDRNGLLIESMAPTLRPNQVPYARPDSEVKEWALENPELPDTAQLLDVIRNVKPTILIGTSTATGAFNEEVVREMAKHVERPIIMPLSNPTPLCEVDPQDAITWTNGKALVATGSPFSPVMTPDGREYHVAQTNNALGAILARSKTISPNMLKAGVDGLSELSPALQDPSQALLPPLDNLRAVSVHVTAAVIRAAVKEGNATNETVIKIARDQGDMSLSDYIKARMWDPVYRPLELVD